MFDLGKVEQYMCEVEGKLVRLTQKEIDIIKNTFHDVFQEQDHLWLFGSRVHSENKGGDIDLYIEVKNFEDMVFQKRRSFRGKLHAQLGEQKIDIVVNNPNLNLYIYEVARKEGVLLV